MLTTIDTYILSHRLSVKVQQHDADAIRECPTNLQK